jgi:hypothetical protein
MKEHGSINETKSNKENTDPNNYKTNPIIKNSSTAYLHRNSHLSKDEYFSNKIKKSNQNIIGLRKKESQLNLPSNTFIEDKSPIEKDITYPSKSLNEFQEKVTNSRPKTLKEIFGLTTSNSDYRSKGYEEIKDNYSFYTSENCLNFDINSTASTNQIEIKLHDKSWNNELSISNHEVNIAYLKNKKANVPVNNHIHFEIPKRIYQKESKNLIENTVQFNLLHAKKDQKLVVKNDINLSYIYEVINETLNQETILNELKEEYKNSVNKVIQFSIFECSHINHKGSLQIIPKNRLYVYLVSFIGIGISFLFMYRRYRVK